MRRSGAWWPIMRGPCPGGLPVAARRSGAPGDDHAAGASLGVTQFRPLDERRNYRREYLLERLAVGLGGRSAEEIASDDITSGAQNDLQQVTRIARAIVTQLGMADELGPEYFGGDDGLPGQPGVAGDGAHNPWAPREYSDATARRIDAAVHRLID